MNRNSSGKFFGLAGLVLLVACSDAATAPTSQVSPVGGRPSYIVVAALGSITPATATVASGGTQQYSALTTGGAAFAGLVTWSVSGGGSIDANGLFTAGTVAGTFTVSASAGLVTATASVTVTVAAPTCKPDDDKKECENEKDRDGKDKGGKDNGDKSHGGKEKGDKNHHGEGHGSGE